MTHVDVEMYLVLAEALQHRRYHGPMLGWTQACQPGDLVLVTFVPRDTPAEARLGTYEGCWSALVPSDEVDPDELAAAGTDDVWGLSSADRRCYWETPVYAVRTFGGELASWWNVGLMRLPRNEDEMRWMLWPSRCLECGADIGHRTTCSYVVDRGPEPPRYGEPGRRADLVGSNL